MTRRLPQTRGDCADVVRPCPNTTCRYHLTVGEPHPERVVHETLCSLDEADNGAITLDEVGEILGMSRQRVAQLEERAFRKIRRLNKAVHGALKAMLDRERTIGVVEVGGEEEVGE